MYYFRSSSNFNKVCIELIITNDLTQGEFYIAPLYNKLIESGKNIEYIETLTDDNIFCGTPEEYIYLQHNTHLLYNG
jgi:hypothetical protein